MRKENRLPLPKGIAINDDSYREKESKIPFPVPRPSDSWLMAHKDVVYDSTKNWEQSQMLLRLGTIAINYDIAPELSDTTFGVKVAFKDRLGNLQTWRRLPFIQPDLTPYIEQIAREISACLSASFVTHSEFSQTVGALSGSIDDVALSAMQAKAVAIEAELCAANAVEIAEDAKLSIDAAVEAAEEAKLSADEAFALATDASQTATAAKEIADEAALSASVAKAVADEAKLSADEAMLSASVAYEKADSVQSLALSAISTSEEAKGIAIRARGDADAAVRLANIAIVSAEYAITMPISTDRLVQGNKVNHLDCGTSTTILE